MKRCIRLCLLTILTGILAFIGLYADPVPQVIHKDSVQVLLKGTTWRVEDNVIVKGTLIIEPGTKVEFAPNSRMVIAAGGRIIADGFASLTQKARQSGWSTAAEINLRYPEFGYYDIKNFLFPFGNPSFAMSGTKTAGLSPAEMAIRERTINPKKYNYIFNVAVDTLNRTLVNIDPDDPNWNVNADDADNTGRYTGHKFVENAANSHLVLVPFETAMMFIATQMNSSTTFIKNSLRGHDWVRANGTSGNITPAQIQFYGQTATNDSREWGHIVVLPGARTAFFRNCSFENFKKDITVDTLYYFDNTDLAHTLSASDLRALNGELLKMSNGGGGAITTFSSRTWIVDCEFNKNFARNRGGAVQILQAPTSMFYTNRDILAGDTLGIPRFDFSANAEKNLKVTDADGHTSMVMNRNGVYYSRYPKIDRIDEENAEYFTSDRTRMAWDDARLAGYLGRFRNLKFTDNMVRLAKTIKGRDQYGNTITKDDIDAKTSYPFKWPSRAGEFVTNEAFGGALYISGARTEDDTRQIEFGLGINDSIRLGNTNTPQNPNNINGYSGLRDYIVFTNNTAQNLQENKNTKGAAGGAIYVGMNTSLIVAGEFDGNFTDAKWLVDTTGRGTYNGDKATPYINGVLYSQGGAIFSDPGLEGSAGRLQIRGDINKGDSAGRLTSSLGRVREGNRTRFTNNRAGAGGAVFVNPSNDVLMSPQIGGSDVEAALANYGYDILFENNYAYSAGGAVYTKRNTEITGAGGKTQGYLYSVGHLVRFWDNGAAFAGGALHVEVPAGNNVILYPTTRIVNFQRVDFKGNIVGKRAFFDKEHVNNTLINDVRGGGAAYLLWSDLNVVRATNFEKNVVYNGNGAGIALINPWSSREQTYWNGYDSVRIPAVDRMFVTDLDSIIYAPTASWAREGSPKLAIGYESVNNPFTFGAYIDTANPKYTITYPDEYYSNGKLALASNVVKYLDARMLNRFQNDSAIVSDSIGLHQITNYGNTQLSIGYEMPYTTFTSQAWTNADNGYIVGEKGNVLKVTKNGSEWEWSYPLNDSLWGSCSFTDVQFLTANIGYISDNYGRLFRTADGGDSWTKLLEINGIVESIKDFNVSNNKIVVSTNKGRVFTSANNGLTWTIVRVDDVADRAINGVSWIGGSGMIAVAVGDEGIVARTEDAGATWQPQYALSVVNDLNSILFVNSNNGFIIGDGGTLLKTTDAGDSWELVLNAFDTDDNLKSISFYSTAVGYISSDRGTVYKTTDAGLTWTKLTYTFGFGLNSVQPVSVNSAVAVGQGDLAMRTDDAGISWYSIQPASISHQLGNPRKHGGIGDLAENGVGLGGAIYILDFQSDTLKDRRDSIQFNRTRMLDNYAFTGSALYSDNFSLKLIFNRSLIRGNKVDTNNTVGRDQNRITGPMDYDPNYPERNYASSDLASTTLYGDIQGPFPTYKFSTLSNSIFENQARFLIRLPDAPNTKGVIAGDIAKGTGGQGTATLKGNYWGHTEANVGLYMLQEHQNHEDETIKADSQMTFFVEKLVNNKKLVADQNYLPFYNNLDNPDVSAYNLIANVSDRRRQGPFEYNASEYITASIRPEMNNYRYISLRNVPNTEPDFENIPGEGTIPEKYLFSFDIYDMHDKGTDIKTADYSARRMFPIEDFAVGNPLFLRIDDPTFVDNYDLRANAELKNKYVKRLVRNPEFADKIASISANGDTVFVDSVLHRLQTVWAPMTPKKNWPAAWLADSLTPRYYHPLGMPIYLETKMRTLIGEDVTSNRDIYHQASSVFFVINETTQDFIRVELKQVPEYTNDTLWTNETMRGTVFIIPDSTNRTSPTTERRTAEGLLSLQSNGQVPFWGDNTMAMLQQLSPRYESAIGSPNGIDSAAKNEDMAALIGRKYSALSDNDRLYYNLGDSLRGAGRMTKLYSNRPTMPTDNDEQDALSGKNESRNTYFAGERYGTIPANVGDVIRIISRNVLWRHGVTRAYDGGIVFMVNRGPEAPEFVGDINIWNDSTGKLNPYISDADGYFPVYRKDQVNKNGEYEDTTIINYGILNKVFVQTDREYPMGPGTWSGKNRPDNSRGTDFILAVTAYDRNGFIDPRVIKYNDSVTALKYDWMITTPNSGLQHWLMVDTIKGNRSGDTLFGGQLVQGYLNFKGFPINPYIVPGGERVLVSATNYAPGIILIDTLLKDDYFKDIVSRYYQTFPPYLNTPYYNRDVDGDSDLVARYLQQDTIGLFGNTNMAKELTIFVMDSLPRFISDLEDPFQLQMPADFKIKADNDLYCINYATVPYSASVFTAGRTLKDVSRKVLVNLTDKLRFQMDLNTDDELEDSTAIAKGWAFPYGRTAYSFANLAISGGKDNDGADTIIVDTLYGNKDPFRIISQLKPNWLQEQYHFQYADYTMPDVGLIELQRSGMMNIRIDSAIAKTLLLREQVAGRTAYNTDTVMAIVANDGHGGLSTKFIDLYINFQPLFITASLPAATEGEEYNMKRDSIRAIKIFDANPDQAHHFELIYSDDPRTEIYLDPSFKDETTIQLTADMKRTPSWLKIEPNSGVLYGITDVIRNFEDTIAKVTVLVTDEDGLVNIETYDMPVNFGNQPPIISIMPMLDCLTEGEIVDQPFTVSDRDLIRLSASGNVEELTLEVIDPPNGELRVVPDKITGGIANDSVTVYLRTTDPAGLHIPQSSTNNRMTITILVTDKAGKTATVTFDVRVSLDVDFISQLTVSNRIDDKKVLLWGTAQGATTGDMTDNALPAGRLDAQYCELEIPPIPNNDVFDARWHIPAIEGVYRNIYPSQDVYPGEPTVYAYNGIIQSGGVTAEGSALYPVTLTWDVRTVPAVNDPRNRGGSTWRLIDGSTNGNYFSVNMHDPLPASISSASAKFSLVGDTARLQILDNRITNFKIVYDYRTDIEDVEDANLQTALLGVTPHPLTNETDDATLSFEIERSGNVFMELYDVLGNRVATILDTYYNAGRYDVKFNLRDFSGTKLTSGAYTVRMTTGTKVVNLPLMVHSK
jgi:predicted outer membrane repeat protein